MYSLKVIAHSASKKSVLATVTKSVGPFVSTIATGNLKLGEGQTLPDVGTIIDLPAGTIVNTIESPVEGEDKTFTWLSIK